MFWIKIDIITIMTVSYESDNLNFLIYYVTMVACKIIAYTEGRVKKKYL